jgi:curved DNA-binding protein CbpA
MRRSRNRFADLVGFPPSLLSPSPPLRLLPAQGCLLTARETNETAKEEHPDKNPNNPKAKERFQELQQAYETLRDQLERSKYDEDNPHHGLERSSYRTSTGVRSGTAKRYATPSHTPGWANGTTRDYEGFAQQAAGSSAKPKTWNTNYDKHEEWDNAAKTNSGFSYQTGGYRPSTRASAEYEDSYREKRESAHAKTSSQREQHSHGGGRYGGHNTSSGSPRPKSTTGTNAHSGTSARYTAQSPNLAPGGFNIADYIREKKAKEEAAAEEKRKQEAEEQKARREVEEQLKRQEDERKAKEKDRRRAEAEANRNFHESSYGARNGYPYSYSTESSPYTRKDDEELQREAEEKVKERSQSANFHGQPSYSRKYSRVPSASRSRATDSRARWTKDHPLHEYYADPENWKHDKSHDDVEVVEATPTDHESDKYGAEKGYFGRGQNRSYRDGAGVYTPPFSFRAPPKEKHTASKPFFPGTDPTSTSAEVGEDGRQQDGNTAKDSTTYELPASAYKYSAEADILTALVNPLTMYSHSRRPHQLRRMRNPSSAECKTFRFRRIIELSDHSLPTIARSLSRTGLPI